MMKKIRRQTVLSEQGNDLFFAAGTECCSRAAEWEVLLYDVAEGLADQETTDAVKQHIAECAGCRAAFADIRRMTAALQTAVPEPSPDLRTRIMHAVSTEEEENGRVLTETVDLRTGHVLSDLTKRRGILGAVSGVAAAFLVVVGILYLLPFLRISSGASSGAQQIIGELQDSPEIQFSDGIFIGTSELPSKEETTVGFDVIGSNKGAAATAAVAVQRYPVVISVSGGDRTEILRLLAPLASDDAAVFTETKDGILVSPLSVYQTAAALLQAADLTVHVSEESVSAENNSATDSAADVFYIRIGES